MAAADIVNDRPNSPSTANRAFEMKEELKEFNRSFAITQDDEIHHQHQPSGDASNSINIISISTISPGDVNTPGSNSINVQDTSTHKRDHATSDDSKLGKKFIAPKDFELLKVIGMGAFGKVCLWLHQYQAML